MVAGYPTIDDIFNSLVIPEADGWIAIPDEHPLSAATRRLLDEMHAAYIYMKRGRVSSHVIRKNPPQQANSVYRTLRSLPYEREVAGGGTKYRT